ncbi:hypothetical protein ACF0H5_001749 [Mactra antiquata]
MGSRFISRIIPLQTFKQYTSRHPYSNVDESEHLIQACYENPLFEEDGTVVNDTQTKVHRQNDGLRTKPYELPNAAQTSVHYKQSKPRKRKGLCILAVILTAVVIIAIVAAIMIGQRGE